MYYIFNPIWKDTTNPRYKDQFVGDNSICYTKFKSIEDGLLAAKIDCTALRETNWEIYECSFFGFIKKRIMLRSLYNQGYLSKIITTDDIGFYYNHK